MRYIKPLQVNNDHVIPMIGKTASEAVSLPRCPKCNKSPLRCPHPQDCGLENL